MNVGPAGLVHLDFDILARELVVVVVGWGKGEAKKRVLPSL